MTKADLVERVTAQISRTAGPMISKKDCARVVDAFLDRIDAVNGEPLLSRYKPTVLLLPTGSQPRPAGRWVKGESNQTWELWHLSPEGR